MSCAAAVGVAAWRTTAAAAVAWVAGVLALWSGNIGGAIVALALVTALVAATTSRPFLVLHAALSAAWLVAAALILPQAASALAWLVSPLLFACLGGGLAVRGLIVQRRAAARRIEDLEAEALRIREEERRALARDLHDVVAHELTVITLLVNGNRHQDEQMVLRGTLDSIGDTSRRALVELRRLLDLMREVAPEDPNADRVSADASSDVLTGLGGNLTSVGIATTVTVDPAFDAASPVVRETCVRVIQEACTNVIKHAGPGSSCSVRVEVDDDVRLRVHNTVPASGRTSSFPRSGYGLSGARERLDLIGGTLESGPVPGGWSVEVVVPVAPADRF